MPMSSLSRHLLFLAILFVVHQGRADAIFLEPFCVRQLDAGIYYGPAPSNEREVRQLKQRGVCEVIDTRPKRRIARQCEQHWVRGCGMCYRWLPIDLRPCYPDRTIEKVLQDIRRHHITGKRGAVYLHCSLGRDRTGLIVALYRVRYLGWSQQRAFRAMQQRQFNQRLVELDHYFWRSVKQ